MDTGIDLSDPHGGAASQRGRFCVLERRDVHEAIRIGVPVVVLAMVVHTVLFGPASPLMFVVGGVGVGLTTGIGWLARRRVRRYPHVAAFAIVSVFLVVTLLAFPLELGHADFVLGYFGLVVVGVALFVPWSLRWHGAWLALAAGSYLAAVAMTGMTMDDLAHAVAYGAVAILVSLVGNRLIRARRHRGFAQELVLRRQRAELRRTQALLDAVAREDPLTGLANRRRLEEDVAAVEARISRGSSGSAAVMVDIDWFKSYNDTLGHPSGDEVLRAVAAATRSAVRAVDHVYRYGGEELLVLIEEGTPEVAGATAERIVRAVRDLRIPHPASALGHVTVSAGAAAPAGRRIAPWAVIDEADRALYAAKDAGRDRAMAGGAGEGRASRLTRSDPAA